GAELPTTDLWISSYVQDACHRRGRALVFGLRDNTFAPFLFFINHTPTTQVYTLSLHDALPICRRQTPTCCPGTECHRRSGAFSRSEEHTSELQSRENLVCRLLLEKKKKQTRPRDQRGATKRGNLPQNRPTARAHGKDQ